MRTAEEWIKILDLKPHPEGGTFRETYRSEDRIAKDSLPARYSGGRPASTAILFLLKHGQPSKLHRLKSDELWHFYEGSPLRLILIHPDGSMQRLALGRDTEKGECFQATIPAGTWFGARCETPGSYSLVGCTVAPGFDFDDFELGDRPQLLKDFSQHKEEILELT